MGRIKETVELKRKDVESRYEIHRVQRKITKKDVTDSSVNVPLSLGVSGLSVSMGLTPKIKSVKSMHLFHIVLDKHIKDKSNGNLLVDLEIEYAYALDISDDISPNEQEVFQLMNDASLDFAINWKELVSNTRFASYDKSEKFKFSEQEKDIEKVIDFWEDSLRNKTLDENLKWDDTNPE